MSPSSSVVTVCWAPPRLELAESSVLAYERVGKACYLAVLGPCKRLQLAVLRALAACAVAEVGTCLKSLLK